MCIHICIYSKAWEACLPQARHSDPAETCSAFERMFSRSNSRLKTFVPLPGSVKRRSIVFWKPVTSLPPCSQTMSTASDRFSSSRVNVGRILDILVERVQGVVLGSLVQVTETAPLKTSAWAHVRFRPQARSRRAKRRRGCNTRWT